MKSDLASSLRRFRSARGKTNLRFRKDDQLPWLRNEKTRRGKLLYDTTVYIDIGLDHFPPQLDEIVRLYETWHCSVTEAELFYLCGRFDPAHRDTQKAIDEIAAIVGEWNPGRVLNPDRETWREAAILTGMVSRLHRSKTEDRGRLMNDALIFLTALKHGCAVLTRNVCDFDLLMQLVPAGRAVFYATR